MELPSSRKLFPMLAGVLAVWWLFLQFQADHEQAANFLFNVGYAIPLFLAAIGFFAAAWQWRGRGYPETAVMVLVGIRFAFYGVAQLFWTYYNMVEGISIPEFTGADVFYLSGLFVESAMIAGFLFHRVRARSFTRTTAALILAALLAAAFAATFVLLRALPAYEGTIISLDSLYVVLGFLALFGCLIAISLERHPEMQPLLLGLFGYLFVGAAADLAYTVRESAGAYWNGDVADGLYAVMALVACFVASRLIPKRIDHALGGERARMGRRAFGLLLLPLGLSLVGLLLSARVAQSSHEAEVGRLVQEAVESDDRIATLLGQAFRAEEADVVSVVAFLSQSQEVTAEEFAGFIEEFRGHFPGVVRVGFVDGAGVLVHAQGDSLGPIGTDYAADPSREEVMRRALLADALAAGGPFESAEGPSLFLSHPVRRDGAPIGSVVGVLPLSPFLGGLSEDTAIKIADVRLLIGDVEVARDGSAFSPSREIGEPDAAAPVLLGDLPLVVEARVNAHSAGEAYRNSLARFLALLFISLTVSAVMFLLVSQRRRVEEELSDRTSSLRATIKDLTQAKFFLDNVQDAVAATLGDRVLYHNQAFLRLLGAKESAPKGMDLIGFLSDPSQSETIRRAVEARGEWSGEAKVRPVAGKERDVELDVRIMRDERGKPVANLTVAHDVTDRKAVERAKTQFVSMVAHQLRTPMTQLRWLVEQVLESKGLPKATREAIGQAQEIVLAENRFVGDLLNVSRIERGVLKLEKKAVPVARIVEAVIEPLKPLAKERRTSLKVGALPDLSVDVDEEKIVQAVRNVVDNAVKYSPKGNAVTVKAEREGKDVMLSITDNGKGIPEELWDKLYDIKTEISPGATASSQSTGLGLYLTKKFVDAMGGRISFTTSAKGTTFVIRLPAA